MNTFISNNIGTFAEFSDAIICVSKEHRKLLVNNIPKIRDKTHYIYNPLPEYSDIGLENTDYGYFGGLNALKGFHILYQALLKLRKKDVNIRLHATKFPEQYKEKFVNSKIDFMTYGRLSLQDFNLMYRNVETVIIPSVWPEPLPYVVLEALLRGRLCIASKIGGIPEEVKDCKGVILCNPGEPLELMNAILEVKS